MTTKHKIGIAVGCIVAIAAIIVWDQRNLSRSDGTAAIATPVTLQTAMTPATPTLPAPAPQPSAKAAEPIICPQDCAAEKSPTPASIPASTTAKKEPERVYTVVQGDSLYGISVKVFGTPRYYERIYESNRDRIKDPNTLQVGINLKMPEISAKPAPQ